MSKKYLIVKKDNDFKCSTPLDDATFEKLKQAAQSLETFNTFTFLGNSYLKAKEDFFTYDFTQFNVREVDMFNMFLNALEAMATNANLWEAYLTRNYSDDKDVYPDVVTGKKKSCRGIKDAEFYENNIEYVVSKVLRNMIAHHMKPYSEIVYNDDYCRQFIVTKADLLEFGSPNKSARTYISNSKQDYYDVVEIIKRALVITEEVNLYMFNFMVQKEWHRFITARHTIREHIGIDWQGAYLVWENPKYPQNHLLYLSQIDIFKNAMNAIRSIAAQSLGI